MLLYSFSRGNILPNRPKTLLPNYDVFDEVHYFRKASQRNIFPFGGENLGVTICEDIWNDKDYWKRQRYDLDPVWELVVQGTTLLLNISASPYHCGKRRLRADMLSHLARKYGRLLFYVNQVGGNDELIFDGLSLCIDSEGNIVWEGKAFTEDRVVIDTGNPPSGMAPSGIREDIADVYHALRLGIHDYFAKTGFSKAVVGLSGGIDFSVVAALAQKTLDPEDVLGVGMPSRYSSKESLEDASEIARNLGISWRVLPIEDIFSAYLRVLSPGGRALIDLAEENLQARIRGNLLMFFSNREGSLLLSTGNKSELAMGYCTLYGDMSRGLAVLADVPKTMVYELAHFINQEGEIIPQRVLTKAPSAELRPNQKDEDSLPPYVVLDRIIHAYIEENLSIEQIIALGFPKELIRETIRRIDLAEYKCCQASPGLRITTKAFGVGRRMPIARKKGW